MSSSQFKRREFITFLGGMAVDFLLTTICDRGVDRHATIFNEAIAFVVAETFARAKDAAEAITASWEGLPPVMALPRRSSPARR